MRPKQAGAFFSALFVCYLIFSLVPVSAYQFGEALGTKARFIIEPALNIIDDLEPINCSSSGYLTLRAYVENVPEFDITGVEASLHDVSLDVYYNVTSAVSCSPKTHLISNEEITCRLNIKELLSKIPACPLAFTANPFYLSFELSSLDKKVRVTGEKELALLRPGTEPSLEINFNVAQPPYPVPEINCMTGSEVDVPVVVHHAEALFGALAWSFSVDRAAGSSMECNRLLSNDLGEEGRDDIYLCTLSIPSTMFPACEEGNATWIGAAAKTKDRELSANFSTLLVARELDLRLRLSDIGKVECQIVDEEGTCYPKNPQRNVTATITGNVPEKLKVFEARYKLGDSNITLTSCKKKSSTRHECTTFITFDKLPLPASENLTTTKARALTLFLDVKYMNYYRNISASTDVVMEGRVLDGLLDTLKAMDEEKALFQKLKELFNKWIIPVYNTVNLMSACCLLNDLLSQLKGDLGTGIKNYLWKKLIGTSTDALQKTLDALIGNGPGLVSCIADKAIKVIEEEQQKLQAFEDGQITTAFDIPDMTDLIIQYYPECRAQNYWSSIKSDFNWRTILKCVGIFLAIALVTGGTQTPVTVCLFMKGPVMDNIISVMNKLLAAISFLTLLNTYNMNLKAIALARERMNIQLQAADIMAAYADVLAKTMESLATSLATNSLLHNLTYPAAETVKLIFISDRTGVLDNGDEICSGDPITIEYNFEKLNVTGDFTSQIALRNSRSRTLYLSGLKGAYGPYDTDALLGTDPRVDPSDDYIFTLNYQDKRLDYTLKYVNRTCT
jgi:hypothetical protein